MAYYYDSEDLGYECGYSESSRSTSTSKGFVCGDPQEGQVSYECQVLPTTGSGTTPRTGSGTPPHIVSGSDTGSETGPAGTTRPEGSGWLWYGGSAPIYAPGSEIRSDSAHDGFWMRDRPSTTSGSTSAPTPTDTAPTPTTGAAPTTSPTAVTPTPPPVDTAHARRVAGGTGPRPVAAPAGTPEMGTNEVRLRGVLGSRGLNSDETGAYMTRFPAATAGNARSVRLREGEISRYLPPSAAGGTSYDVEHRSADDLRGDISVRARQEAVRVLSRSPGVTPAMTYDYLVARGLVDPAHSTPPGADATWTPGDHQVQTSEWTTLPARGTDARRLSTTSDIPTTVEGLRDATRRENYVRAARTEYVAWAHQPISAGGLGLSEADARTRFNQQAEELGLLRRREDGSYETTDFTPTSGDIGSEAQSFFHREDADGHSLPIDYDDHQRVITSGDHAAHFRHENPSEVTGTAPTDPVTAATRRTVATEIARDTLYASLTGELPEGSRMRIEHEGDGVERRTFLVNPNAPEGSAGRRTEIHVIDPPLTRDQATAYMQSRDFVGSDGRVRPDVDPSTIMGEVRQVESGEVNSGQITYRLGEWERSEISRTLSGPPHNLSAQQITRFMNSHHWLGENPNLDTMDAFRRRAAGIRSAGADATALREEVLREDVTSNNPSGVWERDRAADITDALSSSHGGHGGDAAREGRAGREHASSEGRASRSTQIRVTEMNTASQERVARDNREAQRLEAARQRDFQARESRLQREHDSAERARDRENQMMMSLIQFLGQMINGAVQAMGTVVGQAIGGVTQLGNQQIAGIRGRQ